MNGQMSLFDGFLKEICDTKPEIGTRLVFNYRGKHYDGVVAAHCGHDFFWIEFTERKPSDDFNNVADSDGWHLSLRGYQKSWDFKEVVL